MVGLGPGNALDRTPRASAAIAASSVIVGYRAYVDQITDLTAGKQVIATAMLQETERCRQALELAAGGHVVSLVSSGDPGIYGMAGLAYELAEALQLDVEIEIVPGMTAASTAAARLGAPLMLDFAVISLSDLLVPWEQIVNRLLDFSRHSLGQKRLFDPNEVIRNCVDLVRHQAFFHNIKINQELDPRLPQVIGDPGQIQQVFTNLLLNAADAMNGSGTITVSSNPTRGVEGVELRFTDTGCGIQPEVQDKIFDPFFTTKPPGKGTGLGLSIVYGVIQRHGGTIKADSFPGCGTTFTVTLPLEFKEPGPGLELEG